jgi:hypothetical protein
VQLQDAPDLGQRRLVLVVLMLVLLCGGDGGSARLQQRSPLRVATPARPQTLHLQENSVTLATQIRCRSRFCIAETCLPEIVNPYFAGGNVSICTRAPADPQSARVKHSSVEPPAATHGKHAVATVEAMNHDQESSSYVM